MFSLEMFHNQRQHLSVSSVVHFAWSWTFWGHTNHSFLRRGTVKLNRRNFSETWRPPRLLSVALLHILMLMLKLMLVD